MIKSLRSRHYEVIKLRVSESTDPLFKRQYFYRYYVYAYYPPSCLYFKTQRFGDWILSPYSGKTYSVGPNLFEKSKLTQHAYDEGHKICWNEE
jgi:hypothetical protein